MNELIIQELEEMKDIENNQETKERFKIKNLNSANWAFRKLKAIDEREKEIEQLAENEIERINNWKIEELKSTEGSKNFFEALLMEYYVEEKKLDGKFKVKTPYGQITSRKQQPKWIYDDKAILEWLKENNKELIRVKEEVNKVELKKTYQLLDNNVVTEDGEIVEGIIIEERADSINIKVVE